MAERVTDQVIKRIWKTDQQRTFEGCQTEKTTFNGGDFADYAAVLQYIDHLTHTDFGLEIDERVARYLVHNYGLQTEEILQKAGEIRGEYADRASALAVAELRFCLEHEMVSDLCDFLIRRSGRLYFDRPSLAGVLPAVTATCASHLAWSDTETERQLAAFDLLYRAVLDFK